MGPLLDWIERHAAALFAAVVVLIALGAATLWVRDLQLRVQTSDLQVVALSTRGAASEARALVAEASLTGIARSSQATATAQLAATSTAQAEATAAAQSADPAASLQKALGLVFAAYQQPTDDRVQAMEQAFDPAAVPVFRPELDHLQEGGLHLGPNASFNVDVQGVTRPDPDHANVRTHEKWAYDEVDGADRSVRCITEESDQTYSLTRGGGGGWVVSAVQLASVQRGQC